jgi:hypothetical protein
MNGSTGIEMDGGMPGHPIRACASSGLFQGSSDRSQNAASTLLPSGSRTKQP